MIEENFKGKVEKGIVKREKLLKDVIGKKEEIKKIEEVVNNMVREEEDDLRSEEEK